jgi:hypothetical protein
VAATAGGPVTLDEALALARARRPARAVRKRVRTAVPAATPESVGAEQEKLEAKNRAERAMRLREYTDAMTIMKRRGARAPASAAKKRAPGKKRRAPKAAPESFQPLQVVAEGDSWFDYPPFILKGGIVKRLQRLLGVPILDMSEAGDEVRYMLGVEQRKRLIELLNAGCPAGGPWDALLFSGGGNDIVDNPMALWVRDFDASVPPEKLLNQPRFDVALALVRFGYEDLIALRDELSPTTHLVFHAYDFAIPDGRGICHLGPWLKPTFDLRGFPNRAAASAVVEAMLTQFASMLAALESAHTKVAFINGQGTLPRQVSAWHNELHPETDGYDKFAALFHARLKTLFPDRVL